MANLFINKANAYCFGHLGLPDVPDVFATLNLPSHGPKEICRVESKNTASEICSCLNSKPQTIKNRLGFYGDGLREPLEDLYTQKTGERFRSKLYGIFNDLVIVDARIKQGMGLNQNYLAFTRDCRLGNLTQSLARLESDSRCGGNAVDKKKRFELLLGKKDVAAFSSDLKTKIEYVSRNDVPYIPGIDMDNYCVSYKSFMGMKEPPVQAYQDFSQLFSGGETARTTLLADPLYNSTLYLSNPIESSHYEIDVMHPGARATQDFLDNSRLHGRLHENRQDGLMSRLMLGNPAFTQSLVRSPDATTFLFSQNTNVAMLNEMNIQCKEMFDEDNLRALFCEDTYPNIVPETLMTEVGRDLYESPARDSLGKRVNEVTAMTFLCQKDASNTIVARDQGTDNPYRQRRDDPKHEFWDNFLDPKKIFKSDLERMTEVDRTKRMRTGYEVMNETFCHKLRVCWQHFQDHPPTVPELYAPAPADCDEDLASVVNGQGDLEFSRLEMNHVGDMLRSAVEGMYAEGSTRTNMLARLDSELISLLSPPNLPERLNQFPPPPGTSLWREIEDKIASIFNHEYVSPFTALINKVARKGEREELAIRQYFAETRPETNGMTLVELQANTGMDREALLSQVKANASQGSAVHRLADPTRYETDRDEETTDAGGSIFSSYFSRGNDSHEALLETSYQGMASEIFSGETNGPMTSSLNPTFAPSRNAPDGELPVASVVNSIPMETPVSPVVTIVEPAIGNSAATPLPATIDSLPAANPTAAIAPAPLRPVVARAVPLPPSVTDVVTSPLPEIPVQGASNTTIVEEDRLATRHPLEDEISDLRDEIARFDDNAANFLSPPVARRNPARAVASTSPRPRDDSGFLSVPEGNGTLVADNSFTPLRESFVLPGDSGSQELSGKITPDAESAIEGNENSLAGNSESTGEKKKKKNGKNQEDGIDEKNPFLKDKANSNGKNNAKDIYAYEEKMIIPHGVLETHMQGHPDDSTLMNEFIQMFGLEGKRWSTLEFIVNKENGTQTYIVRTYDLDDKSATKTETQKMKSTTYRTELMKQISQWRGKNQSAKLEEISEKTKMVRQLTIDKEKFDKVKSYLASRPLLIGKIIEIAENY